MEIIHENNAACSEQFSAIVVDETTSMIFGADVLENNDTTSNSSNLEGCSTNFTATAPNLDGSATCITAAAPNLGGCTTSVTTAAPNLDGCTSTVVAASLNKSTSVARPPNLGGCTTAFAQDSDGLIRDVIDNNQIVSIQKISSSNSIQNLCTQDLVLSNKNSVNKTPARSGRKRSRQGKTKVLTDDDHLEELCNFKKAKEAKTSKKAATKKKVLQIFIISS